MVKLQCRGMGIVPAIDTSCLQFYSIYPATSFHISFGAVYSFCYPNLFWVLFPPFFGPISVACPAVD